MSVLGQRAAGSQQPTEGVPPAVDRPQYHAGLDGIRAVSIVLVMCFHHFYRGHRILFGGSLGVDIFFVLSGFLITTLLLHEHRRNGRIGLRHFYARRALRLLPLAAVLVIAGALVNLFAPPGWLGRPSRASLVSAALYYANWMRMWHPNALGILAHAWSLAIEEQFYIVWPPLLVWLLARKAPPWALALITGGGALAIALYRARLWMDALAWPGANPERTGLLTLVVTHHRFVESERWYFGSLTRADALLIGCLTAVVLSAKASKGLSGAVSRVVSAVSVAAALVLAAVVWTLTQPGHYDFLPIWGLFVFDVAAAVLIAGVVVHSSGVLSRVLSARPLVWTGRRSYGLYVIHWPVLLLTGHLPVHGDALLPIQVTTSFVLAALSFRYLESPLLRRKRRFAYGTRPLP